MPPPPTVVYAVDPLCGWCFAFGPALDEARGRLGGAVRWDLACGGLVVGERVRPLAADAGYLRAGLAQVEAVTGVRAGAAFLDGLLVEGTWVSDSEPVCRAVLELRSLAGPDAAIAFSGRLTRSYYVDGRPPDHPDVLREAAAAVGADPDALLARWSEPGARQRTAEAFAAARAAGLRTYPSLSGRRGDGTLVPLTEGAVAADVVVDAVRRYAVVPPG